jgi:uncharacterized protein (DUF1778 family)
MDKQRIQIYVDLEMKRRIELAAARQNVAVTEYCMQAITQQLADDDVLEEEQITIPVTPTKQTDDTLIADLRALQERIKVRRCGKPLDVDHIMEEMREERDYELSRVR